LKGTKLPTGGGEDLQGRGASIVRLNLGVLLNKKKKKSGGSTTGIGLKSLETGGMVWEVK